MTRVFPPRSTTATETCRPSFAAAGAPSGDLDERYAQAGAAVVGR
ncbi:hypothetical protein [Streptomyces sp. IMTB 2501]|nr:hypothetical protein [Streptomyces sp. IMTB 2501]